MVVQEVIHLFYFSFKIITFILLSETLFEILFFDTFNLRFAFRCSILSELLDKFLSIRHLFATLFLTIPTTCDLDDIKVERCKF